MEDDLIQTFLMEDSSDNSRDLSDSLSDNDNLSDNSEQEESEESEIESDESEIESGDNSSNTDILLSDIYDELVDLHADVLILKDSVDNVSLCVSEFANVFVEFSVILIIMVLIKTVFDNLLHFFK